MSELFEIGPATPIKVPRVTDTTIGNGLRVIVARQANIPRVHMRLRMPGGLSYDAAEGNRSRLAAETIDTGTKSMTSVEIAEELQRLGGSLHAGAGLDYLSLSGATLAGEFPAYLKLVGDVLMNATFPKDEVDVARVREAQSISIRRSQPASIAHEKLARALYGKHPYGRGLPDPQAILKVSRSSIKRFERERARPKGSTLVIVGDIRPAAVTAQIEDSLGKWRGRPPKSSIGRPRIADSGKTILVDRPGAVQTNIRIGGRAIPRKDPAVFKLALANTIFGGYFSSRLVENIREDKGYTYSPRSGVEHHRRASTFTVSADVASEVTAAALVEIRYELSKMVATRPSDDELVSARTYLAGLTALSIQTQGGLADYLSSLAAAGLGLDYLRNYQRNLAAVTADDVMDAASIFLAPQRLTTVLVGDSSKVRGEVEALEEVESAAG